MYRRAPLTLYGGGIVVVVQVSPRLDEHRSNRRHGTGTKENGFQRVSASWIPRCPDITKTSEWQPWTSHATQHCMASRASSYTKPALVTASYDASRVIRATWNRRRGAGDGDLKASSPAVGIQGVTFRTDRLAVEHHERLTRGRYRTISSISIDKKGLEDRIQEKKQGAFEFSSSKTLRRSSGRDLEYACPRIVSPEQQGVRWHADNQSYALARSSVARRDPGRGRTC